MRTLIISEPSSIGDYDIAVAVDDLTDGACPGLVEFIGMFEVQPGQHLDDVNHVFSQSFRNPEHRHTRPLQFVDHTIGILTALMREDGHLVIAGLGAGLVHTGIQINVPSLKVTSIEYDQTVVKLAREYWDFDGDVIVGDVKTVIPTMEPESIDVLFLNAFSVGNDLTSQGLFKDMAWIDVCMSRLPSGGVLLVNVFNDGEDLIKHYMTERGYGGFVLTIGQNKLVSITKN